MESDDEGGNDRTWNVPPVQLYPNDLSDLKLRKVFCERFTRWYVFSGESQPHWGLSELSWLGIPPLRLDIKNYTH